MKETVCIIQTPPFWLKTPPLSLIYLKVYLKSKDIETEIIDLNHTLFKLFSLPKEEWLNLNKNFEKRLFSAVEKHFPHILENLYKKIDKATFIGLSILKRNAPFAFRLAERIKEKYPSKKIIFGGPQALFLDWKTKLDRRNYWIIGEGEIPFWEIINGQKQKVIRFREMGNLDNLPFLDFSPLNLYSPCIPLLSSRGCMHKCSFCSERLLYKKFRNHSPLYMAEQIKYLSTKHKINNFTFCDSFINYSPEWLEDFCRLIIKNKLKIKWEAQARVDSLTPELIKLIKQSGCYNLFIGLESASDNLLGQMNKGFKVGTAYDFFKKLTQAGLHFEVSLIFGHPQETENDFKNTLDFIVKNKKIIPKIAQANPFVDYFADSGDKTFPTRAAKERINKFINIIQAEKIKHTKGFINNLIDLHPTYTPGV